MLLLTWVRYTRLKSCMHPWSADICEEKCNVWLKRLKRYQKVRWAEIVENTKNLGSPNRIHKQYAALATIKILKEKFGVRKSDSKNIQRQPQPINGRLKETFWVRKSDCNVFKRCVGLWDFGKHRLLGPKIGLKSHQHFCLIGNIKLRVKYWVRKSDSKIIITELSFLTV